MNSTLPASLDEFASGEATRPRRWAARLGERLFAPPYLPGALIGFSLLLYLLLILFQLSQQPAEYWIQWGNPWKKPLFGALLGSGPWLFLAANLGYLVITTGLLTVLTRKVAFPAWLLLNLFHFTLIFNMIPCGFRPFFLLESEALCQWFRFGEILVLGLMWSLAFAGAIFWLNRREGTAPEPVLETTNREDPSYVPLVAVPLPTRMPALFRAAQVLVIALILLTTVGLVVAIAAPRAQWHKLQPAQSPPPLYSFSLAYDTNRQRAVLFGGGNHWRVPDGNWYGENGTWEWDGNTWTPMNSPVIPPPRLFAGMAYDEKRAVTVLYGGSHLGIDYSDTWEWDGQTWMRLTPAHNPGPRERFQMVYDPQRQQVVFYGGLATAATMQGGTDVWYTNAWGWDGADWTQIPMQGDLKICCYATAMDPISGTMLMFNGEGLRAWDGDHFIQSRSPVSPPGRGQGAMATDPDHGVVISFGGDRHEKIDDTWQYDGKTWKEVTTADRPDPRVGHALFFDTVRRRVLLFGGNGGNNFYNDTWELVLP